MSRGLDSFPAEVTSFVGRRQATAEVKRTLSTSRLVTLTGVGGTGKSRLALHVAQQLRRAFADGVWLVELADLRDPSLLADAVAATLGLTDLSNRDREAVLVSYLANKRLLLVLDNCEHLLGGCAHLAAVLLPAAPGLRVLATSREPLGIAGEHVWPVPPLSVPRPEASLPGDGSGRKYEALVLFEERAAAVVPGFTLNRDNERAVARLCQRLDGLPLAIELAAVRLRALTVPEVLARLEDRFRLLTGGDRAAPARHQALRAAVGWSFDLCTELERTLWARLSVFAGGFELAAAEQVCSGDGLLREEAFTGLTGLVDKSLLIMDREAPVARYRMLETIRQYGHERLTGGEEVVVRRRHRDYYLRLCEEAAADWFGPNQVEWLNRFQAEQPNVWKALEFCLTEPGEARTGLRMAGALYWYWHQHAIRDGRRWLDRALACDTEPSPERSRALWVVGWIATAQGDIPHALTVLNEAVDRAREFDDEQTLGHALQFTGMAKWFQGELSQAVAAHEQALAHYRAAGAVNSLTAMALSRLGTIVSQQGDAERAVALCQEGIDLCIAQGEQWARAWGLWNLASARWLQHDLRQADINVREALRLKIALGDRVGIAWCFELLGWVAAAKDDAQRAAVLFGMGDTRWGQIGQWLGTWQTARDASNHARSQTREALGQRRFGAAFEQGQRLTDDEALTYALSDRPAAQPAAASVAPELPQLTRREREVAALVAKGMSNKDIAATLMIAQRTAEAHIDHILTKLAFTSRAQIAAWITEKQQG
ncbi:ATP-binding protein [Saccharopolyspora hattusasensis]|uniref:ATP-binding protein n=1 Tax=Saccharopolyspora hattusasensis TaxID=1128679 RepID=UPI003D99F7CF